MLLFQVAVTELVRVVTQCGHLVGDTIVQGSATSHMVPVEQADGEFACDGNGVTRCYSEPEAGVVDMLDEERSSCAACSVSLTSESQASCFCSLMEFTLFTVLQNIL